jgi:hypothetical protein
VGGVVKGNFIISQVLMAVSLSIVMWNVTPCTVKIGTENLGEPATTIAYPADGSNRCL